MELPPAYFTRFNQYIPPIDIPEKFTLFHGGKPNPLCSIAIQDLQEYLQTQREWKHNFGLTSTSDGSIAGKMFGVLVVQTAEGETGYLSAFSGKLAGTNQHTKFVPPVYDLLSEDGFLKPGMELLAVITQAIKDLQKTSTKDSAAQIIRLKTKRRKQSVLLQQQIFEQYHFVNKAGISKGVYELFAEFKNPPSGAGECAGPKLLQYAFQQNMRPLALAEFWWGQSPKSTRWKHGEYYACCKEKCEPILAHMLLDINN